MGRFTGALLAAATLGLGATGRTALVWPWPGGSLRGTVLAGDGEGRAAILGAACFLASAFFAALLLVVAFRTMSLAHSDLEFSTALHSSSSPDLSARFARTLLLPALLLTDRVIRLGARHRAHKSAGSPVYRSSSFPPSRPQS